MVEVLIAVGVVVAAGVVKLGVDSARALKLQIAHQQSIARHVMDACEAAGIEGFEWYARRSILIFDGDDVSVTASQAREGSDAFESMTLTFHIHWTPLFIKEPSHREARRRLLRGFGVDGRFGIGGKDDTILEWLTEDLARALVDALDGGWSSIRIGETGGHSSKTYNSGFSLTWRPEGGRALARAREELELLMPLAARAVRAWEVGGTKPERLAKLARSHTVSSEVNWRAAQLLLTAHAHSDAARALTSSLDGLSAHAQMACVTWGECEGLRDDVRAALLRDVVTKGPEPMVDALVARLEEEGVRRVHASALSALAEKGFDLSRFEREDGALDGLGGRLSIADQGPRGALSEAAPSGLRGALTSEDGGEA